MPSLFQLLLLSASILSLVKSVPCPANQTAVAAPTFTTSTRTTSTNLPTGGPQPPSKDHWYTAPEGYKTAQPGTVLKSRPIPGGFSNIVSTSFVTSGWNLMYATTDSHYNPSWAVTTLFAPANPVNYENSSALLSYQFPYDSVNIDESPSWVLQSLNQNHVVQSFFGLVANLCFLNVPDYEGPNASFAAGVASGHAVLDSIRAAVSFGKQNLGMHDNVKQAMWGYSGGAFASEWAAELQVQYAPEMEFAGVALGGLTPNISSVLQTINESGYAGLIPAAIIGMSSQYPEVQDDLIRSLKTTGKYDNATFFSVRHLGLSQVEKKFAGQDISQYFVNGMADLLTPKLMNVIYRDGIMGYHGVPQMPLYIYQAEFDEVSPIGDLRKLVADYCDMGANIELHIDSVDGTNTTIDHYSEGLNLSAAFWLNDILNQGYVPPARCG